MTVHTEKIRLLDLEITDGARQLAMTEAIMNTIAAGESPPTLRLYSWSEPVVILGVGQPVADLDLEACDRLGHRVLRRVGGGTAVYHDEDEVSVDLIVPTGHQLAPSDVHEGYQQFSAVLEAALASVGIRVDITSVEDARAADNHPDMRPLCFASISPYEFLVDGKKLNGLCQIRRRNVTAYQTAIYRRFSIDPLIASLQHASSDVRNLRTSHLAEFVTDLSTVAGRRIGYVDLQNALAGSFAEMFDVTFSSDPLTEWEGSETERLVNEKYASPEWTFRR